MATKEKFKTYKSVFDDRTLRTLFKLESEGYFEELVSPISIGKESNIFTAKRKDGDFVIVKIYRVNNADFKRMYKYICSDSRFEGLSNKRAKVVSAWAQREYRNLLVAYEAGANVPMPYVVKDNVLVMGLIGNKDKVAPRLKELAPKNPKKFSNELIKHLNILYNTGFVHGDLSEFNLLNHNEVPYIIDLSHGTKLDNPLAKELLERDIKNLVRYFNKLGLKLDMSNILGAIV